VLCSVCYHPKYSEIHARLKTGEPVQRVANDYGLPRSNVARHHRANHPPPKEPKPEPKPRKAQSDPRKNPPEEREPMPSDEEIASIRSHEARTQIVARYIDRGLWRNLETAQKFARLWPDATPNRIARYAGDAAEIVKDHRGSKLLRREVIIAEGWRLYRKAYQRDQLGAALNCLRFVFEADGLAYEPGLVDALLESKAWALVEPVIKRESPYLYERLSSLIRIAESARRKGQEIAENPALALVETTGETVHEETFAAPRNVGGRRPKDENEGSAEG
jgi:hypothetical protein